MSGKYKNIVILTGAGISAESGLETFRSSDGLWNKHRVEDVATIEGFEKNPSYVHAFYNEMKKEIFSKKPNPAHLALAELEKNYDGNVWIVTQNIDLLHEKAGSQKVFHIHGQIDQAVCLNCGHIRQGWDDVDTQTVCAHCKVSAMMKPNIVFFGEQPLFLDEAERLVRGCDLFVSVGTSGVVYPAAGFVQIAKYYGAETIEFNLEKTRQNILFDTCVEGKCGKTLPLFVKGLLRG